MAAESDGSFALRCRPPLKRTRALTEMVGVFVRSYLCASFMQAIPTIPTIEVTHRRRSSTSCHDMALYLFTAMRLTLLCRTGDPKCAV